MQKLAISLGLAALASVSIFGGIYLSDNAGPSEREIQTTADISAIQDGLSTTRTDLAVISEQLARIESAQLQQIMAWRPAEARRGLLGSCF